MNLPNLLTSIRLAFVPIFLIIFFSNNTNSVLISFLVFLAAGLTDVLDGYIARKYNMVTKWGSILDPFADKLMSLTVLLSLTIKHIIPVWIITIIGIKEIVMIVGAAILFNRGTYVAAKVYGKITTVIFYIAVITLEFLDRTLGFVFIYIMILTTLIALYEYMKNFENVKNKRVD